MSTVLDRLPPEQLAHLGRLLAPRLTRYIKQTPTPKQTAFLLVPQREALFGGAAGPGKSSALLMAALQYVDHPQYHAVIFRRSYADLSLDGGLIERSKEWLGDTDARYSDKHHRWTFPSGATLSFGYIQNEKDRFKYKSTEFQFVGWDELTQFRGSEYTYLFSRLRKTRDNPVPLRVRAASNPGDLGHLWVKDRFILQGRRHGRVFIPAKLTDNPHLDVERYLESLRELDPITRAQLLEGNWDISPEGKLFQRHWFKSAPAPTLTRKVRYWDLASGTSTGDDPDYTVGCLMGITPEKTYHVLDVRRFRTTPQRQEQFIRQTAEEDGHDTPIYVEREPGSHTVHLIDHYRRNVLAGFTLKEDAKRESKEARAAPFSSMAEAGHVTLSTAPWNRDFLDELELFPTRGVHDDQMDAASGAFAVLAARRATPQILAVSTAPTPAPAPDTRPGEYRCIQYMPPYGCWCAAPEIDGQVIPFPDLATKDEAALAVNLCHELLGRPAPNFIPPRRLPSEARTEELRQRVVQALRQRQLQPVLPHSVQAGVR
jgi:predicted phage terminase large subunit-like protein